MRMVDMVSRPKSGSNEPLVMVIEDNLPIIKLYQTVLCSEGYKVKYFSSASSIYNLEEHAPFDVLITELMVRGRETLPLVREIKRRYPLTYVIIATKYDLADDAHASLYENGVDDVFRKPFSIQVLLASMKKELRSRDGINNHFPRLH